MKTDLSHWYNFLPEIKIYQTTKQFYSKFNHKLVYDCNGCTLLPAVTSLDQLMTRINGKQSKKTYNTERLFSFFEVYNRKGNDLKFRIEGNTFGIFCKSLETLFDIANNDLKKYSSSIQSLTTIIDTDLEHHLDNNKILVKTPTEHLWRVNFRSGFYRNKSERQALHNYLVNLRDQVKVSKNLLNDLTNGGKYVRASYIHVKDRSVVDIFYLIVPGIVRSVQEIVVLPQSK